MTDVSEVVLWGVGAVVALWLVISASGALPLLMLARVDLQPLSPESAADWLKRAFSSGLVDPGWLEEHAFEPTGVYQVTGQIADPHMIVWQRRGERTYFCMYSLVGSFGNSDFVTSFDEGGLTTGTSRDGLLVPPRPGRWMQAFPVVSVAGQWSYHMQGLQFLKAALGKTPSTQSIDFRDEFVDAVRAHTAYVRSLPLWFLAIPYWYVARRFGLFGKTVELQFNRHGAIAQ